MTSKDFVYWLQGFFELSEPNKALTPEQIQIIRNHLKLVFLYEIDPSYSDNKIVQQIFQNIHDGKEPLLGIQGVSFTGEVKPSINTNPGTVYVKC
jgi:hypothetical protein